MTMSKVFLNKVFNQRGKLQGEDAKRSITLTWHVEFIISMNFSCFDLVKFVHST